MTITIQATFENGVLKPKQPISLAEGTEVELTVRPAGEDADPLDEVIGICTEGPDTSLAARHDEILYGVRPPNAEGR
jgi:predicted DNA-binding antitoxin AbrB/MazE fold protein